MDFSQRARRTWQALQLSVSLNWTSTRDSQIVIIVASFWVSELLLSLLVRHRDSRVSIYFRAGHTQLSSRLSMDITPKNGWCIAWNVNKQIKKQKELCKTFFGEVQHFSDPNLSRIRVKNCLKITLNTRPHKKVSDWQS